MNNEIEQHYDAKENSLLSTGQVRGKNVFKTTWFRKGAQPTISEIGWEAEEHKTEFLRFKAREEAHP